MFPPRLIFLASGLLFFSRFALGQATVINSQFISRFPQAYYFIYQDSGHWSPAEVPNNTASKLYNVNIDAFYQVEVGNTVPFPGPDEITISNLTLGGTTTGFKVTNNFTVTGTTTKPSSQGYIEVDGTFDAGTFTAFADHTLAGNYTIEPSSLNGVATFRFRGADIWTFRDGSMDLGPGSVIEDEFGNSGLRNFGHLESSATIYLNNRDLLTLAPFLNEGTIYFITSGQPRSLTAIAGLKNFDPATHTLSGGRFVLIPTATLRFPGADIVNLASTVSLGPSGGIVDLPGNDGLRNLAHILAGAGLTLTGRDFTTVGSFTNDGTLEVDGSTFTITGALNNFDAASHTLLGGNYVLTGTSPYGGPTATLKFSGADIVHNQASISLSASSITDLAGNDGLRNFAENLASGSFTVGLAQVFNAPGDFTNAGSVTVTYGAQFHDPRPSGQIRLPAGSSYIQTGGSTVNGGTLTADNVKILGGSFFNRGLGPGPFGPSSGQIKGNLSVSNATFIPRGGISGNLTLGTNARYHTTFGTYGPDSVGVAGSTALGGTLEVELGANFPANSDVFTILQSTGPMSGAFANAPNGARVKTTDAAGSFLVVYESNAIKLTSFELSPGPAQLLNISTRAFLSRSDDDPEGDRSVLIGGFIISGKDPKKVVVRGMGPSLAQAGVTSPLADPTLELHASDGSTVASNNDWRDSQETELMTSGLAPQNDREAALVTTLAPGTYTVVIREKNGLSGTGVVEVYDISGNSSSKLANISTRGFTDGSNILIGGIIAGGPGAANAELVVRARGPGLAFSGIYNSLPDPTLELRDANGNVIGFNDDADVSKIPSPLNSLYQGESALRVSLPRGNYTALVRAKPDRSGIALVEFYDLRANN